MPIHDWTRVPAGIFHDFHREWLTEIKRALNAGLLPDDYYALAEQFASGFGPDVLTLQGGPSEDEAEETLQPATSENGTVLTLSPPQVEMTGETDMEFYRRKLQIISIRHVSGDRVVAMVEIISPSNKASRNPFRSFVEKACELLDHRIHLAIVDVLPPGPRDPQGIHAAIWEEITAAEYKLSMEKPLTLVSYESGLSVRAYVAHGAVGEVLTDMPLFLEPGAHVTLPLENTYEAAFQAVPRRWRLVLEKSSN